jgi:hypothetical protein
MSYTKTLQVIIKDNEVIDIKHEDYQVIVSNMSTTQLKQRLHDYVDGKKCRMWDDNDPEERSTIVYVIKDNKNNIGIYEWNNLSNMIFILNNIKTDAIIYEVSIEDNVL